MTFCVMLLAWFAMPDLLARPPIYLSAAFHLGDELYNEFAIEARITDYEWVVSTCGMKQYVLLRQRLLCCRSVCARPRASRNSVVGVCMMP